MMSWAVSDDSNILVRGDVFWIIWIPETAGLFE